MDKRHRSQSPRYAQPIDGCARRRRPTAVYVIDLDSKRKATLCHISELSPREHADVVARMQENSLASISLGAGPVFWADPTAGVPIARSLNSRRKQQLRGSRSSRRWSAGYLARQG